MIIALEEAKYQLIGLREDVAELGSALRIDELRALAEHLSIDISEVIAVGDSTNDATLVKAAGLGLAMKNAFDEVKERADGTICAFDENSADYILKH